MAVDHGSRSARRLDRNSADADFDAGCEPTKRPTLESDVIKPAVTNIGKMNTEGQAKPRSIADSSDELLSLPAPPMIEGPNSSTLLSCGIFGRSWHHLRDNARCARQTKSGKGLIRQIEYEDRTWSELVIDGCEEGCLLGCCGCCFCEFCGCGESPFVVEEDYPRDFINRNRKSGVYQEQAKIMEQMDFRGPTQGYAYIMVGLFNSETGSVKKRLVGVRRRKDLFRSIHKGANRMRPLFLRILSLKEVGGFALYQCRPSMGYHTTVELDSRTSTVLLQLFQDYSSNRYDFEARWKDWVFIHLNGKSCNPADGKYGLQLVLRWSTTKLVLYTSAPILLSLVVGIWYMHRPGGGPYVVTQTAWTISSYIVTTAGVLIALLAAITIIGDK